MSLPHESCATLRVALAFAFAVAVGGVATARAQTPPPPDAPPVVGDPVIPPAPAGDPAAIPPAPGGDAATPPVPESYGGAPRGPGLPPPAQAPAADSARVESLRHDDAHADHVVLGPTAFTAPRGTVYMSDYELLVVQGGVAITDELQVTLTTLLPVLDSQPFFADLSAKYAFLKTPRFHMAGIASILGIGDGGADDRFALGRATLVATGCITENCYVAASASAMLWLSPDLDRVVPMTFNVGVTARLVGVFSLLAEANFAGAFGDLAGARSLDVFERGALFGYGARFSSGNFGFDLTFVKPVISGDSSDDFFVIGVPWLAFTYRTDPLF